MKPLFRNPILIFRGESVEAVLAKEITLKHMAPVIDIEASSNPTHTRKHQTPKHTQLLSQVLDARGAKVSADSKALGSLPHKVSWNNIQAHCSSGPDHK